MSEVYTEIYTEKSFVVRGDTKSHKESLKLLKGKWNASLTDKSSGEKFGGWIYPMNKKESVDKWIQEGCQALVTPDNPPQAPTLSRHNPNLPHAPLITQLHSQSTLNQAMSMASIGVVSQMQTKIDLLEKRVKELELMVGKNSDTDSNSVKDETEDDEEQVIVPRRRLLAK
jgi:hypothetical protein